MMSWLTGIGPGCREPAEPLLELEVASLSTIILRAPHNESAWNYLRGLCCSLKQSAPLNHSPREIALQVGPFEPAGLQSRFYGKLLSFGQHVHNMRTLETHEVMPPPICVAVQT